MQGDREKVAISDQYLAIARKRLKIDGYAAMRLYVTFTAIVPGVCTVEAKMRKNVLKW